jgi:dTDP-4-amino-4,6-dideoxygalactose transaminase
MKIRNEIDNLAILGGEPAFRTTLHVGQPNIENRDRFLDRVTDILDRRWLTNNGFYVREFERKVSRYLGVKHCVAMCNATVALEIAERALGLRGEVIVPSMTFIATAHSLQWQEITPVFCDIDPETHNIDPRRIERLITPRTTGIIGVHLWGRACDVRALSEIAKRKGLKLLFDAAHAFGCSHKGKMIGGFGDAEILSFHATKFINTLEGGAVVTNNDELAEKLRLMRNFGFAGLDNVIYIGTNGKMNEISAAMGLTSLESLPGIAAINHRNYQTYQTELSGVPGIQLLSFDERECNNYQYIVMKVDQEVARISRDLLVKILHAENIRVRRYFYPGSHRMEPYRSFFPNAGLLLPETEKLVEKVVVLPNGTSVSADDVKQICEIIRFVIGNGSALTQQLAEKALPFLTFDNKL